MVESEGVSGDRDARAGVGLSWVVMEVRPWERLRFLLCRKRQRETAFAWKEFWPLKAHVVEGQEPGL